MITELISLNSPQQISVLNNAISEVDIWGRGTGKSFIIGWEINQINRTMPRAITSITGQTYGQLLTRTLPSTFKFLEELEYEKDEDYVIGRKPPKGFITPYEKILNYEHVISFANGNAYLMLSQDRAGSARGPNVDRELIDEALTINKERYDQEVSPTNRGNEDHFGFKSPAPIRQHHGFRYVSSMPYSQEQRWLLDYAKYYEDEAGIQLFDIWNRIVKFQIELIEMYLNRNSKDFKDLWNEIVRLRAKIAPFVSKDGILFTLANAFDNITNLGMKYLAREYKKQTLLTFLIEILNWVIDKVEDCYYQLDPAKHIYYNATNDSFIQSFAEKTDYDFKKLGKHDSRFDLDCDSAKPIEIVPDWGAKIALFSVAQERNFNFVTNIVEPCDCTINEFFVKLDEAENVMIDDLVDQFCQYYEYHGCKELYYYHDRYGDSRQPNVKNSKPYNEQAVDRFVRNGWKVYHKLHKGQEPPQHEKYLLWANLLKGEQGPRKMIFNGTKCKYTLISMNNTKVIESKGKFEKDKSSERKGSVLPQEATHFSDAVDKRVWTKYSSVLYRRSTFVEPRM